MRGREAASWARQEKAKRVLGEVLRLCDAESIDVLPVKGILTARTLYEDPAERWIQDIDFRVRPRDLRRLKSMGTRAGWRVLTWSPVYRNLVFDVDGFMAEFEAFVGPPGFCRVTVDELLSRAEPQVEPFGFPYKRIALTDHALVLVINAFKDKLNEATEGAIRDLEILGPRIDAPRLAALATRADVATVLWIVADWLTHTRNVKEWREVLVAIGRPPRERYAAAYKKHLLQVAITPRRRAGGSLVFRLLARAASDAPEMRALALATMGAWIVEQRLQSSAEACTNRS